VGNRIQLTDPNGTVITYGYDVANRLTTITYPDASTVTFTYDSKGNRVQMVDSLGTTTYSYDTLDRLVGVTDPYSQTVGYGYDPEGNRTLLTYPDGKQVSYAFDALNRLTTVTDWLGQTTTYTYDPASRLVGEAHANGTTAAYTYDAADRLTALTDVRADASVIAAYTNTLDPVGNPTQVASTEPVVGFATGPGATYTYDAENRLTDVSGTPVAYDANGNMTAKGADTYTYDFQDRLTQTVIAGAITDYRYDGLGNRYERTVAGTSQRYVLDVSGRLTQVLADTDASGNITAYYVYGQGLISRIQPGGKTFTYHYDPRGTTVALSDAAGTLTDRYAYDEFGNLLNRRGATPNPFRYLGRHGVQDEGDGLNYIRARYYAPEWGRFVSKDPMPGKPNDGQTLNRYVYALNNSIVLIDPSGLFSWKATGIGMLQLAAAAGEVALGTLEIGAAAISGPVAGTVFVGSAVRHISEASKYGSAATENFKSQNDNWVTKDDYVSPVDKFVESNTLLHAGYDAIPVLDFAMGLGSALGIGSSANAGEKIADAIGLLLKNEQGLDFFMSGKDVLQFADFQMATNFLNIFDKVSMVLSNRNEEMLKFSNGIKYFIDSHYTGKNAPIIPEVVEVKKEEYKRYKK